MTRDLEEFHNKEGRIIVFILRRAGGYFVVIIIITAKHVECCPCKFNGHKYFINNRKLKFDENSFLLIFFNIRNPS